MTIVRAVRLISLAALASLMMTGGPQPWATSLVATVTLVLTVIIVTAPSALLAFPAWVFRALRLPAAALKARVSPLPRAWWLPTDG